MLVTCGPKVIGSAGGGASSLVSRVDLGSAIGAGVEKGESAGVGVRSEGRNGVRKGGATTPGEAGAGDEIAGPGGGVAGGAQPTAINATPSSAARWRAWRLTVDRAVSSMAWMASRLGSKTEAPLTGTRQPVAMLVSISNLWMRPGSEATVVATGSRPRRSFKARSV